MRHNIPQAQLTSGELRSFCMDLYDLFSILGSSKDTLYGPDNRQGRLLNRSRGDNDECLGKEILCDRNSNSFVVASHERDLVRCFHNSNLRQQASHQI